MEYGEMLLNRLDRVLASGGPPSVIVSAYRECAEHGTQYGADILMFQYSPPYVREKLRELDRVTALSYFYRALNQAENAEKFDGVAHCLLGELVLAGHMAGSLALRTIEMNKYDISTKWPKNVV